MNILVTGANGQLGRELRRASLYSNEHFIFSDISGTPGEEIVYLDVADKEAVELIAESEKIDLIINCAAFTNVDKSEDDLYMADLLNHQAPRFLAEVSRERGARLIHISTDYVFDGWNHSIPYREVDEPQPCNAYGATKLAGEREVIKSGCEYIIIRTAWMYSAHGKNFMKTILNIVQQGKSPKVVFDSVGTPTFAGDLADAIMHIIDAGLLDRKGLYHYSNEGVASWYDFAEAVCRISGSDVSVQPVLGEEYPTKARRPSYSVLDKSLFKATFGVEIPYWRDSLEKCMKSL